MNYRHVFHAGNFADVFKHCVLIALIEALQQKEKGCCFIDTHAGVGLYDLHSEAALRNPEYLFGIEPLLKQAKNHEMPSVIKEYVSLIQSMEMNETALNVYPGSPFILKSFLRSQDELILNEWHPDDYLDLKKQFRDRQQVHCHHRDAYEFLPAILPPHLRRALILIDPPYEKQNEYASLTALLEKSIQRFPQGVFAVWYPIVHHDHELFIKKIKRLPMEKVLVTELILTEKDDPSLNGLRGCGMIILNAPYQLENTIITVVKWLQNFYKNRCF